MKCPNKTAIELLERLKEWGIDIPDKDHQSFTDAVALTLKNFSRVNNSHIEQRIVGMEMVIEKFGDKPQGLHNEIEVTTEQIYDYCDEIYGGDSQHVRGKSKQDMEDLI